MGTKDPIDGAIVFLYKVKDNDEILLAISHSNEYGQFVFSEVELSKYEIKINSLGYLDESMSVEILKENHIMLIKPTLMPDPNTENGTVSGIITNNDNTPIVGADVILYKVDGD